MEHFERKIRIERFVGSVDTTGDGELDTIKLLTTDKYVPIVIKQTMDDLGIYTDYDETENTQTIDLSTLWDNSNDGSGDGGEDPTGGGISNPYIDGEVANTSAGTVAIEGCTDPSAINYYELANVPCNGDNSCCDYGFGGFEASGSGGGGENIGSCHRIGSGWVSEAWSSYQVGAYSLSVDWCKGIASSCGGAYPILNNCEGNGCGGSTCCPGPTNSHTLFGLNGTGCPPEANCNGTACCGNPFELIKLVNSDYNNSTGLYYHTWHFYCVPT